VKGCLPVWLLQGSPQLTRKVESSVVRGGILVCLGEEGRGETEEGSEPPFTSFT
jgi:hypothetical protein